VVGRRSLAVEAAEKSKRFEDGQLVGELRLLELDAEPLPQRVRVALPAHAEHFHLAGIGSCQALADLDRRRLAGAVGSDQAEALARADLEIDAVNGDDVVVLLVQVADPQCGAASGRAHVRDQVRDGT
jgi:hypothetical protein